MIPPLDEASRCFHAAAAIAAKHSGVWCGYLLREALTLQVEQRSSCRAT
jgi:hypothetical protein